MELPGGWAWHPHVALGSTNDEARRLAEAGAARAVVTAQVQQAGRGRGGRGWASPAGNLYASFILRPQVPVRRMPELGFVAAVAVAEACQALGAAGVALKWPNDVLLGGAKLAGILTEMAGEAAVVGVGLNLASAPDGLPYPTARLPSVPVEAALRAVADALAQRVAGWQADGFGPVRAAWAARGPALGARLSVRNGGSVLEGAFAGLDVDGALLLDMAGARRRVVAGDVAPG